MKQTPFCFVLYEIFLDGVFPIIIESTDFCCLSVLYILNKIGPVLLTTISFKTGTVSDLLRIQILNVGVSGVRCLLY